MDRWVCVFNGRLSLSIGHVWSALFTGTAYRTVIAFFQVLFPTFVFANSLRPLVPQSLPSSISSQTPPFIRSSLLPYPNQIKPHTPCPREIPRPDPTKHTRQHLSPFQKPTLSPHPEPPRPGKKKTSQLTCSTIHPPSQRNRSTIGPNAALVYPHQLCGKSNAVRWEDRFCAAQMGDRMPQAESDPFCARGLWFCRC